MIIAEEYYDKQSLKRMFYYWKLLMKCVNIYKHRIYRQVINIWKIEAHKLYLEKIKPLGEVMREWLKVSKAQRMFDKRLLKKTFSGYYMYTKVQRFHPKFLCKCVFKKWNKYYIIEKMCKINKRRKIFRLWKRNIVYKKIKEKRKKKADDFYKMKLFKKCLFNWISYRYHTNLHAKNLGDLYMLILPFEYWNTEDNELMIKKAEEYYDNKIKKIAQGWLKILWRNAHDERVRINKATVYYEKRKRV